MAKHLVDRDVAYRAVEEIYKRNPGVSEASVMRRLHLDRKTIYYWKTGVAAPSTFALKAMCHQGYDITYILSGRRAVF